MTHTGHCQCGAVRFEIDGELGPVSACHCTICRRITGHYFADTEVAKAQLRLTHEDGLTWYQSSHKVRRGFCGTCGSVLFFEPLFHDWIAIAMGALDGPSGKTLEKHIFIAEKGDYYTLNDGAEQE